MHQNQGKASEIEMNWYVHLQMHQYKAHAFSFDKGRCISRFNLFGLSRGPGLPNNDISVPGNMSTVMFRRWAESNPLVQQKACHGTCQKKPSADFKEDQFAVLKNGPEMPSSGRLVVGLKSNRPLNFRRDKLHNHQHLHFQPVSATFSHFQPHPIWRIKKRKPYFRSRGLRKHLSEGGPGSRFSSIFLKQGSREALAPLHAIQANQELMQLMVASIHSDPEPVFSKSRTN